MFLQRSRHFGCSLTIQEEGSCSCESVVADVAMARVAGTLGYVLHRASATNHRGGAHKRENAYGVVMAAVTLTVVASGLFDSRPQQWGPREAARL